MADHQDVVVACRGFKDALFGLSQDERFAEHERSDFGLLFTMYQGALNAFTINPAFGASSPQYDRPRKDADGGTASCAGAMPGDLPSQQPVFDHAHKGTASLTAVTARVPHIAGSNCPPA